MAVGDSYATEAEYRGRVTKTDTADDPTILAQLKAVSHYLDQKVHRRDGFNQSAAVEVRMYDIAMGGGAENAYRSEDGRRIFLPDDIATATGLIVKCDLNGDYDVADSGEELVINTDFWVGPANAAAGADPAPYDYLDIHPKSTAISTWPRQRRALEITAKFGWPAVPPAIKELTVAITRQIRDMQESGVMAELQAIDNIVETSRELSMRLADVMRQYGRGPSF